jgi:hypothetical protein
MAEVQENKCDYPMSLCIYFCKGKPIPRLLSVRQGTSRFCVPIELNKHAESREIRHQNVCFNIVSSTWFIKN